MSVPTAKQSAVLDILRQARSEGRPVPTIRELGVSLGLSSTSSIAHHLNRLADHGLIRWERGKNRAIELTGPARHCPSCTCGGAK